MESTAKLFTYHQDGKMSNDDYSIMFNAAVASIKVPGGPSCHHPGLASLYTKRFVKKTIRRDHDPDNIASPHSAEIVK